ncbi:NAD-dependent epimerase/dehydratase family protein [Tianweitania populi]|uniref:NAD-dependent dehydratase n=1 Tax=Tianweitania populi TaxID=1607949 RepID=A0A8J3DUG4_9HYPH|nr:NAD-dependent epimerase/dehydratase family protein [Tianweitania populi]GHD21375.1 NAD-dependent dehydratase [Tianweitania populi]
MAEHCILITGGAGFIGIALADRLTGRPGSRLVALDNLHPQIHPSGKRPPLLHEEAELVVADVCDSVAWDDLLARFSPEVVIHLAAETGTAQSLDEASRHANVNVTGTAEMLDALSRNRIQPRLIVLASSRAVYGEGLWQTEQGTSFYPEPRTHVMLSSGKWDPDGPNNLPAQALPHAATTTFPRPSSIYGSTKLAQENILSAWCGARGVPLTIFRFQNVYGPGQSPFNAYTGIINIFHRLARKGDTIPVYEDGQIVRDFVFIDDVADAVVAAVDLPDPYTGIIDVGTGTATTIQAAAEVIAELNGAPAPEVCGKFRDGDVRSAVADITKMVELLGVRPTVDFREGSARVGQWLVANGYA